MIAYLSPHEVLQSHAGHPSQTRARAIGLALAGAGHAALLIWLLNQTYRQVNPDDNTSTTPPMIVQTLDLTPTQPAPNTSPTPASNDVHATTTPLTQRVDPLPVNVAKVKATGPVAINSFFNPAGSGTLTLGMPTISHTLTNPDWISRPNADQVERAYPEDALRQGITGSAMLNCQVTSAGGVIGCTVNTETPAGRGFGRAALGLARYFRIRPGTDNGEPTEGASVLIPIRFQISG